MKLLIVSDAWHPQLNGVVRTLEETAEALAHLGHEVKIVGPEKTFFSFPAPTYPEIRLEFCAEARLKEILDTFEPNYIHISTEGPLGMAMRNLCLRLRRPFSSAYHTCFPEYVERRVPWPFQTFMKLLTYQWVKLFHAPSGAVMVATDSIAALLRKRRIKNIRRWSRGVDTSLFYPRPKDVTSYRDLPRPIMVYVGRVAVEKNIEAFLDLDVPGSKVVIGDGPHEAQFREKYKNVTFLGRRTGEELARHYAGADLFVFPSKTDTFGLVLLEALACGIPVAAYPVQGPIDVLGNRAKTEKIAALDDDLKVAVTKALALNADPLGCHAYVRDNYSWEACTKQFLHNLQAPTPFALRRIRRLSIALDLLQALWRRMRTLPKFYPTLYRAAGFALAPLLPLYLNWRVGQGKEDEARVKERFGYPSVPRPPGKLIWCHAASVGESLSLLPLLERLKALPQRPNLLLTTGTRSSARVLEKRLPEGIIHQYVPLDTLPIMRRFFKAWQPNLVLITESELWPNMLGGIRREKIPAALLNARMSASSAKRWDQFASLWIAALLSVFKKVIAQSEADAKRLRDLGAYSAQSYGNLKAAAPPPPYDEEALQQLKTAIGTRPLWLMASTHEGEEEIALQVHENLKAQLPELLTIIVPRHPERAEKIMEMIARHKLPAQRRSINPLPDKECAIYLADTLGEMGVFYRLAQAVCVGGSFVKVGGHNPLEPASTGCAVVFGPDMHNFEELAQNMLQAGAAFQAQGITGLEKTVCEWLQNASKRKEMIEAGKNFAARESHVLERVMTALQPLLHEALEE
jgi:3-deoxy-D-manno-octulosonic-acid transferase